MAKKKNGRGYITPYRTYLFTDKDPIIDLARTAVKDSDKSYTEIHADTGVSTTTLYNWFGGKTRRPQFCTVAAVLLAVGKRDIDLAALRRSASK